MIFVKNDNALEILNGNESIHKIIKDYDIYSLETTPYFLDSAILHNEGKIYQYNEKINIKSDTSINMTIIFTKCNRLGNNAIWMFQNKEINENNYLLSYPLTKISDNEYIEGYWFQSVYTDKLYPFPKSTTEKVDVAFIEALQKTTDNIANNITHYCGFSSCRLCKSHNGNKEYSITKNGILFRYPEGLIHYYTEHNVQPSKEFYDFIKTPFNFLNFMLIQRNRG